MEAQRTMRLHHMLFHLSRNGWKSFPGQVRAAYRRLGWAPPRPALDAARRPILTNNSGEDFLYMHHQMIREVNRRLKSLADPTYPTVAGWPQFPAPNDPDYPVPPAYATGDPDSDSSLQQVKSVRFYTQTLLPQAQQFQDPGYLKTVTLGELGAQIEFTVHNWAHMRWSAAPTPSRRPDPSPRRPTAVAKRWDAPKYDWLGDFYSSHVNSIFWKLHGWVDERIADWKRANGISGAYRWKGTWSGKMPMPGGHQAMHEHLARAAEDRPTRELSAHVEAAEEALSAGAPFAQLASPFLLVEL
jgi:hypothetical protein